MTGQAAPILVLGDEQGNVELVSDLLSGLFGNVLCSFDPSSHAADLAAAQPTVLVLAFGSIDASQNCLQLAYEGDPALALRPHSTVVLCDKHDVQRAFQLCRERKFDDYVLFWPVSHDGSRLPMAVTQALRMCELKAAASAARPVLAMPAWPKATTLVPDESLRAESEAVASAMRMLIGARTGNPAVEEQDGVEEPRRREPCTVLFVEDDPDQYLILRSILADTELTPVFTSTAVGAGKMLKTLLPGVILVDVKLPDGSGVDLIRKIRTDTAFSETPIITVTGDKTRSVVLATISAGATDFVAKPYSKATLLAKLRRVMNKPAPGTFALTVMG